MSARALILAGLACAPLSIGVGANAQSGPRRRAIDENVTEREAAFRALRSYPFASLPGDAAVRMANASARLHDAAAHTVAAASRATGLSGTAAWRSLGPAGSSLSAAEPFDVGRVSAIAVDPSGRGVYVGAATGGVWHASTLGAGWTPLSDNQCSLNTGAVVVDPKNPEIIYAGTGEFNTFLAGCGLLRSTDGGASWTASGADVMIPPGNAGLSFSSIYIDSATAGGLSTTLLVGTTAGLYRSTNSGTSWTQVLNGFISGIASRPDNHAVLFAGVVNPFSFVNRTIYRSSDGGLTWTPLPTVPNPSPPPRFSIATTPAAPNALYVLAASPKDSALGLYKWNDDDAAWTTLGLTDDDRALLGRQMGYDMALAVDPANAQRIYLAGTRALQSTDGGATFRPMAENVHVDWHAIVFDPRSPGTLYGGTDGGIYQSVDGGATWTAYNSGLTITQYYPTIGVDPRATTILGGTQDNGVQLYTGNPNWRILTTGDAGSAVVSDKDASTSYAVTIDGSIWHFSGSNPVGSTRPDPSARSRGPLAFDPVAPRTLYYGTTRLYRSTDAGSTWAPISQSLVRTVGSIYTVALPDSKTIYVGTTDGYVWVSRDAGAGFTLQISGLPNRAVTHIAVDTSDAGHAVLTMSGFGADHVFETRNFGGSWRDISASLGDLPTNAALIVPGTSTVLIGTDLGAYQTGDDGASWEPIGSGLPNVNVQDLAYAPAAQMVIAATYGRGVFGLALKGSATILAGDVNGDGTIDAYDALLASQASASGSAGPGVAKAADANCDGRVDAADVTLILRAAVGLPNPKACVGTIR